MKAMAMSILPHVTIAAASMGYVAYSWTKQKSVAEPSKLIKYTEQYIIDKLTDMDILNCIEKLFPYAILSPDEFGTILRCLATMNEVLTDGNYKASTPREFSTYCSEAVEALRSFRYTLKEKYPHVIDDFDQEATDYQNMINTLFTNVLRDSH